MPLLQTRRLLADAEEPETDWTNVAAEAIIEAMFATASATKLEDTGGTVYESRAEYDALGRAVVSTFPDGSVQRSGFNARGLPDSVELDHVHGATQTLVERVEYDAKAQRTLVVHGADGVQSMYEYDARTFRLRRMQTARPGPVSELQDLRYFYDPVGNITRQHDASQPTTYFRNQAAEAANDYTYDALYRLIRATGREHESQGCGALPTHDDPWSEGRAPAGDDTALRPFAQSYWYDEVGNISKVRHQVNDSQDCWTREYSYAVDGNRLRYTKRPSDLAPTVDEFAYDTHGNMTTMPGLSVMSWTSGERLAYSEGGVRVWYQYDGGGTRVRKFSRPVSGTGTRKERVYLGGFEIYRAWNGAGVLQERTETLNLGGVLAERKTVESGAGVSQSPGYRFQLGNHQGSVTLEVDGAGKVISWEEYHPYGTTAFKANGGEGAVEVSAKRYRYTGLERDEETGLGYHGARYYAAWLGRWTAADPIGLGDGVNRYAYVRGNPVGTVDRTGTRGLGTGPQEALGSIARVFGGAMELVFGGSADPYNDAKPRGPEDGKLGGIVGGVADAATLRQTDILENSPTAISRAGIDFGASQVPVANSAAELVTGRTSSGANADRRLAALSLTLEVLTFGLSTKVAFSKRAVQAVGATEDVASATRSVSLAPNAQTADELRSGLSVFSDAGGMNLDARLISAKPGAANSLSAQQRTAESLARRGGNQGLVAMANDATGTTVRTTSSSRVVVDNTTGNGEFFARSQLSESGELTMDFRTQGPNGERGLLRGASEFRDALNQFGNRVTSIRAVWEKVPGARSDNWDRFWSAYRQKLDQGLDYEKAFGEAALDTHTGRWAKESGFSDVSFSDLDPPIISSEELQNLPTSGTVGAVFTKPSGS